MRPTQRHIPSELPVQGWEKLFDLRDIESLMQGCARSGKAICYAEALDCLGLSFSRPKMRSLCVAMAEVDRRAAANGEPELAVLLVRASDGIPGAGWWTGREDKNYNGPWEGPRAEKDVKAIQQRAFDYWRDR